jgi:cupin fold WbuC family metalloprotein
MNFRKENEEVFYTQSDLTTVGPAEILLIKEQALLSPRKRARLCLHRAPEDPLHEMLIVHTCDTYVRPHKHRNKSESFHIIEGAAAVILFNDNGKPGKIISMGDHASGRVFYYRLAESVYHTLVIISDVLIFHESTNGPFRREETLFAPWSPDGSDPCAAKEYQDYLTSLIPSA